MSPKKYLRMMTQESDQKGKCIEHFYCHLCRINFEDSNSLCMHIMRKHRPSSKFYEGNTYSEKETEGQNGQVSETIHEHENPHNLDISASSHQISKEGSNNDQMLGNSLNTSLPVHTKQASSSSESLLQNQIRQNILQCTSHNTREKGPKIFNYTYENILKWQETFQNKFALLKLPWPARLLATMEVVLGILYEFCDLSTDKEAVLVTKEVIEQIEDLLKRHENMQIK